MIRKCLGKEILSENCGGSCKETRRGIEYKSSADRLQQHHSVFVCCEYTNRQKAMKFLVILSSLIGKSQ